jgi:hypothetical protein
MHAAARSATALLCRFYWAGYNSFSYPNFIPVDGTLDAFKYSRYSHWGTYFEGGKAIPEPRNQAESQTCAGANHTQTYGSPAAWGWGTASCGLMRPFVCRNVSEWRRRDGREAACWVMCACPSLPPR